MLRATAVDNKQQAYGTDFDESKFEGLQRGSGGPTEIEHEKDCSGIEDGAQGGREGATLDETSKTEDYDENAAF